MAKETVRESYYKANYVPTGTFIGEKVVAQHRQTGEQVLASKPLAGLHCVTRVLQPLNEAVAG